ncbi:MAG: hypothetical protein ACI8ZB_004170 [Desulforhopalus sp.]|jgi:hypothetical protein
MFIAKNTAEDGAAWTDLCEHFDKIKPAKDKNYLLGIIKYFKL